MEDNFISNPVKISVRMPKLVDEFFTRMSIENNKTKQDILSEAIIKILPDDFKTLIGNEEYDKLLNRIKEKLMKYSDEDFILLFRFNIVNKKEYDLALELYDLAYKDQNIGVVKRNNFIRLLTLKECYIEQLKRSICDDSEIIEKYNRAFKEIQNTRIIKG